MRRIISLCGLLIFAALLQGKPTQANTPPPAPLPTGWHNPTLEFEPTTRQALRGELLAHQQAPTRRQAAPTDDDYITALARGLENDPTLIFEFVNNHIHYEPIFGWRNDATATLLSGRGTDADQATLFVELMREAGFTANYRFGAITYDTATLANLLGTDATPSGVGNLLVNAGQSVAFDGNFTLIRVWAEATIDGQTFQFDPAMKTYSDSAGLDIGSIISYDAATFRTNALNGATVNADSLENMNEANVRADLETFAMELVEHIETTMPTAAVEDVVTQRDIVPQELTNFSTQLPNALNVQSVSTLTELPDTIRHSIQLQYQGIDQTLFADEISSSTLAMRFNGSNEPELTLDNVILATGNALTNGVTAFMDVTIDHPYQANGGTFIDQSGSIPLRSGDSYTFMHDFGYAAYELVEFHVEKLFDATGEAVIEEVLAVIGRFWTYEARLLNEFTARQGGNVPLQHHLFGAANSSDNNGHGVDIPFAITITLAKDGTATNNTTIFRSFAMIDSAFEHGVLEQMADINAVSTIALLTFANATGEEIFFANTDNWQAGSNVRSQLTGYTGGDLALMDSLINAGRFLIIPQNGSLQVDQFDGFGVIGASDNAISMLISGGLNGGFGTTDDPANVSQLQRLFNNLGLNQKQQQQFNGIGVNDEPVEMAQGRYIYSHSDLRVGEDYHFGLDLRRNYNSGDVQEPSTLGNGWAHAYDITIERFSDPDIATGSRRAIDVAQVAVAAHVLLDLLAVDSTSPNALADWMMATLVTNWQMDQLTDNIAQLKVGGQVAMFHQLADGSFAPPSTTVHELQTVTTRADIFQLDFYNGASITFDAQNRAQTWTDANGNTTTFTYTGDKLTQVATSTGYQMTFAYTGDLLTSVTDMDGRSVSYAYDGNGNMTSYTDAAGNVWRYGYDADGQMTQLFRPLDAVTPMMTNTYDEIGQVIQQQDALGNIYDLFFSPFRTAFDNPDGSRVIYHYNDKGLWTATEDVAGNKFLFDYDGLYRIQSVTGRDGGVTQFSYDLDTAKVGTQTNALGRIQTHTYSQRASGAHDLTRIDFADGTNIVAQRDVNGNITQLTDQAGKVWTLTYNAQGKPLTLTYPSGGTHTFTYNADGTLATHTDSDTGVTSYTYDALKRLTTITHPDGSTRTATYDALDRIVSVTDERGNTTAQVFDADGRRTSVTDAAGNSVVYGYDAIGRKITQTSRTNDTTTFAYDSLHRITQITDPDGVQHDFSYDTRGRTSEITINGFTAALTYTDEGFLNNITTGLGNGYGFTPNLIGLITGLVDPLTRPNNATYDELNRLTTFTDGLNRTTTIDYDGRGLLSTVTEPVVGTATAQYGELPFVATLTDLASEDWTFGYTAMGRPTTTTDPLNQTTTYTYDNRGRRATATYADGTTATYTYDATNNVIRKLYSDGTDLQATFDSRHLPTATNGLQFTYDASERVINTTTPDLSRATRNFGATYDETGRVETVSYDGVLNVTYTYDATTGLLKTITDDVTNATITYTYDGDQRITGITRSNGVNATLQYDNASQLTRVQDGGVIDLQYSYDAAGQITGLTMDAPLTPQLGLDAGTHAFTYDAASQIDTADFSYDERGRITADPDHTYTWDADSRLTQIDSTALTYTGFDDVQTRTANGTTTTFHYNYAIDDTPIMAEEIDGQLERFYVYAPNGVLLYLIENGTPRFYHFDIIGSTLALTDNSGAITDAYAYSPFGKLLGQTGSSDQPFKFVGGRGVRHEGGDLYQMRARYYDAETQRFLSREPIWPDLRNPERLNPYQYAENEPILTTDPSGLTPEGGASGIGLSAVNGQFVLIAAVLMLVVVTMLWERDHLGRISGGQDARVPRGSLVVALLVVSLIGGSLAYGVELNPETMQPVKNEQVANGVERLNKEKTDQNLTLPEEDVSNVDGYIDSVQDLFPEGFEDPETGTPLSSALEDVPIDDDLGNDDATTVPVGGLFNFDFNQGKFIPQDGSTTSIFNGGSQGILNFLNGNNADPDSTFTGIGDPTQALFYQFAKSGLFPNDGDSGFDQNSGFGIINTSNDAHFQSIFSDGFESGDAASWTDK